MMPQRERARIRDAGHPEEGVEGARRRRQLDAAGGVETLADDGAAAARAGDLLVCEIAALLQRRDGGALQEGGDPGSRILDEVLDRRSERRRRLEPADAPAGHGPVLGEGLHEQDAVVRLHDVVEGRRAAVDRQGLVVDEAGVDLVGDDPQAVPPRERENGTEVVEARGPAGRVGRRVDDKRAGARRHGVAEAIDIERPACGTARHRHRDRPRPRDRDGAVEIRPGRRRDENLVAGSRRHAHGDLGRVHAPDRDRETVDGERPPVQPLAVAGDRLAQLWDALLPGVEGLAGGERARCRVVDEGWGRQVPLPAQSGIRPGPPAPVGHGLDDAAGGRVLGFPAQREDARARERRVHGRLGSPANAGPASGVPPRVGKDVADFGEELHVRRRVGLHARAEPDVFQELQPVDGLDDEEQDPGDDQEVDEDGDEVAPGEDGALLLCLDQASSP